MADATKNFKVHRVKGADKAAPKPLSSRAPAAKDAARSKSTPQAPVDQAEQKVKEIGGPAGPEPTRYGDWEIKGRCIDF